MPHETDCDALPPADLQVADRPYGERSRGRSGGRAQRQGRTQRQGRPTSHQSVSSSSADPAGDVAMLAGFRDGDPERARAFVRRFQGRVYGLALKMTGDPVWAEDVAQDALLRAWRGARSFDSTRGSVSTWLLTITRNAALDALRRHRPESVSPHAEAFLQIVATGPLPSEIATVEDEMGAVRDALSRIPLGQRRAVVLASLFRFTATEIAETEGIPLGTAKTRIRSGMLRLRAELQGTNPVHPAVANG